jgi:hypothetical protein
LIGKVILEEKIAHQSVTKCAREFCVDEVSGQNRFATTGVCCDAEDIFSCNFSWRLSFLEFQVIGEPITSAFDLLPVTVLASL